MMMANARMDLSTFVGKLLEEQDGDVLREGVRVLAQALMDTEVTVKKRRQLNGEFSARDQCFAANLQPAIATRAASAPKIVTSRARL
jgi:hypothetical protein